MKLLEGRPNPRVQCAWNTTRSSGFGAGTISPAGGMRQVTKSGDGSAPRAQSSAICSWVMVEPFHIDRGPATSAIDEGEGGGDEGSLLVVVSPEERLDRERMKEARARKKAMAEEESSRLWLRK